MRLTTRLRLIEAKLSPVHVARRFVYVFAADDGPWHDTAGHPVDPARVTGPVRVMRLIPHVEEPPHGDGPEASVDWPVLDSATAILSQ